MGWFSRVIFSMVFNVKPSVSQPMRTSLFLGRFAPPSVAFGFKMAKLIGSEIQGYNQQPVVFFFGGWQLMLSKISVANHVTW